MGKLIVITAPSGAGKTTIVRHLLKTFDFFGFFFGFSSSMAATFLFFPLPAERVFRVGVAVVFFPFAVLRVVLTIVNG